MLCWTACKHCYSKCRDKELTPRGETLSSDYNTSNLGNINKWDCLETLFLNQSMIITEYLSLIIAIIQSGNEKNDIGLMLLMDQISISIWVDKLLSTYCGFMSQNTQVSRAQTTHVLKIYIIDIWWGGGKIRHIK